MATRDYARMAMGTSKRCSLCYNQLVPVSTSYYKWIYSCWSERSVLPCCAVCTGLLSADALSVSCQLMLSLRMSIVSWCSLSVSCQLMLSLCLLSDPWLLQAGADSQQSSHHWGLPEGAGAAVQHNPLLCPSLLQGRARDALLQFTAETSGARRGQTQRYRN